MTELQDPRHFSIYEVQKTRKREIIFAIQTPNFKNKLFEYMSTPLVFSTGIWGPFANLAILFFFYLQPWTVRLATIHSRDDEIGGGFLTLLTLLIKVAKWSTSKEAASKISGVTSNLGLEGPKIVATVSTADMHTRWHLPPILPFHLHPFTEV